VVQPNALVIHAAASKVPAYSTVSVRVKDPGKIQVVEDAIKKMGFNTFSMLDATAACDASSPCWISSWESSEASHWRWLRLVS